MEFHAVLSTMFAYQSTFSIIALRLHCECLSLAGVKYFIY